MHADMLVIGLCLLLHTAVALPRCSDSKAAECASWARASRNFQAYIQELQRPASTSNSSRCSAAGCFQTERECRCRRVLEVTIGTLDGFALESQVRRCGTREPRTSISGTQNVVPGRRSGGHCAWLLPRDA